MIWRMNNPAARLHSILSKMPPYRNKGDPASVIWANILRISPKEIALVNFKVAEIFMLPNQIEEHVRRCEGEDHALFLEWMPDVSKAIQSSSLGSGINNFATHISDSTLLGLRHCSHLLSKNTFEVAVDVSKMNGVWGDLNSLYEEVRTSPSMDKKLKYYILRHLDLIRNAIRDYDVNGATPIHDAIDAFVGTTITNKEMAKQMQDSTHGEKIWKVVEGTAVVLGIISALPQLAQMTSDAIDIVK